MDIFQPLSFSLLFIFSFFAYLSFSVVTHDALAALALPLERRKADALKLAPLTMLYEGEEKLLAILQFCRLLFVVPVLLITFYWLAGIHWIAATVALILLIPLLYMLPGRLTGSNSRRIFRAAVRILSYVLYPGLWVLVRISGPETRPEEQVEETRTNGEREEEQSEEFKGNILKAVSMIGDTTVREVMTPRVEMVCLSASATLDELHQFFKDNKFSRIPVFKERVDNIAGVVSVMDFVSRIPDTERLTTIDSIMRPALFVPETKKVFTLLREFRESHAQMAIVIDEYGGTSGLVTLEDLLEEIVGEIEDEFDEAPVEGYRDRDGAYVVTGKFPIERLEEIFGVEVTAEDFETISGLIFSLVGRIPLVGEIVKYENLNLEILEADKRRIHRVRIEKIEESEKHPSEKTLES